MVEYRQDKKQFFITPEWFAKNQSRKMMSPRGHLLIASCRSGSKLANLVVKRYQELLKQADSDEDVLFLDNIDYQFTDTETCVRLEKHVGGYDVFLFQSIFDPTSERTIDENYMAFVIAARTLKEHGAKHVTGVLPYLAYARQDKPTKFMREPTTAKLMADLAIDAGIDRLINWDPHSSQIHGFYGGTPLNLLDPLTLFSDEFSRFKGRDDVIAVAPDVGASKFATHFGRALEINSAIASKYRPKPEEVIATEIIGNFKGKNIAIVLDDMVSSGGTVFAVIQKLVKEKDIKEVYLGISHNLCVGEALNRLRKLHEEYHLKEMVVTNSIPQTKEFSSEPFVKIRCLSDIISRTINRIHYNSSVSEIFYES